MARLKTARQLNREAGQRNRAFLDLLADRIAHDFKADRDSFGQHVRNMSGEEAAYTTIAVMERLGSLTPLFIRTVAALVTH